jgi:hypothetical protein
MSHRHGIGRWCAAFGLVACGVVASGCGSDDEETTQSTIPAGCNPITADWDCLLPFPSDYFLQADAGLPSGHRVVLTDTAKPLSDDGVALDLTALHPMDGFSPGSQILALFPSGIDDSGLVFHDGGTEKTLSPESTTLLIDATTGEPVMHFAEVDPRPDEDSERGLIIRPMVRLHDGTRYIVAIQGLKAVSGEDLAPPSGFRRIRDGKAGADSVLGPVASHYESDVFPVLETFGVKRENLILAWDFSTRSEENAIGDMLKVRDSVMAKLAEKLPEVQVTEVKDAPSAHIWRQVELSAKLPLYIEKDEPLSPLHRDATGAVAQNGEVDVPFSIIIPASVGTRAVGSPPARLLQYGHGFFGKRSEAEDDPAALADEKGFVVVAVDWVGMADEDRFKVADALAGDTNNLMLFTDRVHQAMANFIAVAALAQGPIVSLPELQTPAGPAYDPSVLYYDGNSQGSILGSTYVALSPSISRAVFGVGGNDFSFIMFRAAPFALFLNLMGTVVSRPIDQLKLAFMTQSSFDRIDPLSFAPHLLTDTFPGSPASRQVLQHIGIGDHAVPPLSAELQARSLGVLHLSPAPRPIPGLSEQAAPIDGSAISEFDFGIDPEPGYYANPPTSPAPGQTDVHEAVRRLPAAREQLSRFLKPGGLIEQTCDGVCDPE